MTSSGVDDATYVNVCKKVLGWLKDWNQKYNKVSDSRRVADYRGQYIGESQYKDKYIELADMLYRMIPDGLTYQEASEILEDDVLNKGDYSTDLSEAEGGGIITVISFVFLIYLIVKLNKRRLIILDEAFTQISDAYFDKFIEFVNQLCTDLGFDI